MQYTIPGEHRLSESHVREIRLRGSIGGFNMCYPLMEGGDI